MIISPKLSGPPLNCDAIYTTPDYGSGCSLCSSAWDAILGQGRCQSFSLSRGGSEACHALKLSSAARESNPRSDAGMEYTSRPATRSSIKKCCQGGRPKPCGRLMTGDGTPRGWPRASSIHGEGAWRQSCARGNTSRPSSSWRAHAEANCARHHETGHRARASGCVPGRAHRSRTESGGSHLVAGREIGH